MLDDETVSESGLFELDNSNDGDEPVAFLHFENSQTGEKSEIPIILGKDLSLDLRVGRDEKCDHIITDERISKMQFRIYSLVYERERLTQFPPMIYCEDLDSLNGTYVNDHLIGIRGNERVGYLLSPGDVIGVLPCWKFRFDQTITQEIHANETTNEDFKYFEDRFRVSQRKLGSGDYGRVYLATETRTLKQVACKVVDLKAVMQKYSRQRHPAAPGQMWASGVEFAKEEKARVLREIEILSQLSHPNIVDLKKAFCSNNMLYMVTELASGGDLFSYLESEGGQVKDIQARVITRQIALALKYLHSKEIAHRDVKPENILITKRDFGHRVVLTDFGLATLEKNGSVRMSSTVGTQGYTAPEIQERRAFGKGYTTAVDMWSFGIVVLYLLAGDLDLPDLGQVQIAERLQSTYEWTDLRPRARRFLSHLLVINPQQRMTAKECLEHSWYTKPYSEAAAIERAYERVTASWKPRKNTDETIEHLPSSRAYAADKTSHMPRRKFPDATLSPYFNLDRHLKQKEVPERKRILADLNNRGSHFVTNSAEPTSSTINISVPRSQGSSRVQSVDGNDLFKKSTQTSKFPKDIVLENDPDLDEVSLVPTEPVVRNQNNRIASPKRPLSSSDLSVRPGDQSEARANKRARKETDHEDDRIHDVVSKALPALCSAKVYKDAVTRAKITEKGSDTQGLPLRIA